MSKQLKATLYYLAGLLAVAQVGLAQVNPQGIANSFYPQSLITAAQLSGESADFPQLSCFAVYDSLANGDPRTIIAGYSNGFTADIRVIQANASGIYNLVYEPMNLALTGADCGVQLLDVNGDGVKEVWISFNSARGNSMDWIFTWNGNKLVSIGPTYSDSQSKLSTVQVNTQFVDLLHDGTMQIVTGGEYPPPLDGSLPTAPMVLYQLAGGKFSPQLNPVLFAFPFEIDSSGSENIAMNFTNTQTTIGPYSLKVVNGDKSGENLAVSGTIILNGQTVLSPSQLNSSVQFATMSVNIQAQNSLKVELQGNAGATVLIEIEGHRNLDLNGDGIVDCPDLMIVQASFGKTMEQEGFNPVADVNGDGIVNILDLSAVSLQLPAGTTCK